MLLLDQKTRVIDGISVFPDHVDPLQYYYMPLAPRLTTVRDDTAGADIPQFSLIRYFGDAGNGGFLNFDVNLGASDAQINAIQTAIRDEEGLDNLPRIAAVPVVEGTVRLLMLGQDSQVGATPIGERPAFVADIDHHTAPSLYGNNQAAFSVALEEGGVTVLERCLDNEIMPVAVVYSLQYLGLRPAYSIRLSIDWDRVQQHMSNTFSAGFLFSSVDISNAVDELAEQQAIVLETDTFVTETDENDGVINRRDAALAQVRAMITDAFFTPSLPPFIPGEEESWADDLKKAAQVASMVAMGPAGGLATSNLFSYSEVNYTRIDRKALNVNMSERVTVQRTFHPQGHLAGLFKLLRDTTIPRERFVTRVNLDDPWFRRRMLTVTTPIDFEQDQVHSINVRVRYGEDARNEFLTAAKREHTFEWTSIVRDGAMIREVEVEYDVRFSDVDATERPLSMTSDATQTQLTKIAVDPRELYTMRPVPVRVVEGFPWARYPRVEVQARYEDETMGLDQKDIFVLSEEESTALWQVFMLDRDRTAFSQRITLRAADHADIDSGWREELDQDEIRVFDPFPRRHVLQVVANLDWTLVDRAFVDLRYEDQLNDIFVDKSFELAEGGVSKRFEVPLVDPQRKEVFYTVTVLFKDGRLWQVPESITRERRIFIRSDMRGRRLVAFQPPDFEDHNLSRVSVDARFEDFQRGISINDTFQFDAGSGEAFFEYDYVDATRDRYEVKVQYLFRNGTERSTDWVASDDIVFRIPAP